VQFKTRVWNVKRTVMSPSSVIVLFPPARMQLSRTFHAQINCAFKYHLLSTLTG